MQRVMEDVAEKVNAVIPIKHLVRLQPGKSYDTSYHACPI